MSTGNKSFVSYYERGGSGFKHAQALVALVGIISNTLAICVFERKQLKKHSYSNYWKAKALVESILLFHVLRNWMRHFLGIDIDLISLFSCRFNQYLPYVLGGFSLWFEAVITLDRFFTIVYSNRFLFIKKRSFQIGVFLLIGAYSFLVNINLLVNFRLEEIGQNGTQRKICYAPINALKISSCIGLINTLVVNIVVNPVLDLIIICYIISTRGNVGRASRTTVLDRKFAISAIGLNVSSLLMKFPFQAVNLLSNLLNLRSEAIDFVFSMFLLMLLFDKADIFLLNILVNSVFRHQFFAMIGFLNKSGVKTMSTLTKRVNSDLSNKVNNTTTMTQSTNHLQVELVELLKD